MKWSPEALDAFMCVWYPDFPSMCDPNKVARAMTAALETQRMVSRADPLIQALIAGVRKEALADIERHLLQKLVVEDGKAVRAFAIDLARYIADKKDAEPF